MCSKRFAILSPGRGHQADTFHFVHKPIVGIPGLMLLLVLLLTSCGGSGGSSSRPPPDVNLIIKDAQAAIQRVTSYHFKLVTDNPGTGGKLPITNAEGDI